MPRRVRLSDARAPVVVPLLRASCDGSGACCGLYHHVPATTEDRDRVLQAFGDSWAGPVPLDQVFQRAFDGRENPLNIVAVGGSCAFCESDGKCGIHARMGAGAKPQSCLSYPAHLVACGAEWHASLRPECACVARSANEGSALSADPEVWVNLRGTLSRVWAVPRQVAVDAERFLAHSERTLPHSLDAERSVPRDDYVHWIRATAARLKTSFDPIAALEAARLDLGATGPLGPPDPAWLAVAAGHLAVEAADAVVAFDEGSPYRRSIVWAAEVTRRVLLEGPAEPQWSRGRAGDWARRSSSVLSLLLHGHGLLERPLLADALDDVLRILHLARASEALRPTEEVDPRLESVTMWLFLWRNVKLEP